METLGIGEVCEGFRKLLCVKARDSVVGFPGTLSFVFQTLLAANALLRTEPQASATKYLLHWVRAKQLSFKM